MLSPVQSISQSSGVVINLDDGKTSFAQSDASSNKTTIHPILSGADIFTRSDDSGSDNKSTKTDPKSSLDFSGISNKIQTSLKDENLSVEFSMDKESKTMVLKIVNSETNEVVRQFPPEVSLKIARMINDQLETGKVADATV